MKRLFAAACAAMLLTGSLTACGRTADMTPNTSSGTAGTNGTTSGTSYTAPTTRRSYPGGAEQDRASYNRMTSSRSQYDGTSDGRYTAYSDGTVSPNTRNTTGNGLMDAARDLVGGAGNAVRDVTSGVGNAMRDAGTGLNDMTKIPHN